ncbi:unnamed protein product [Chrysoparadoxa australica]
MKRGLLVAGLLGLQAQAWAWSAAPHTSFLGIRSSASQAPRQACPLSMSSPIPQESQSGQMGYPPLPTPFPPIREKDYILKAGEVPVRFINIEGRDPKEEVVAIAIQGDPLTLVAAQAGIDIPTNCNTGLCGTCTCDLEDPNSNTYRPGYQPFRACVAKVAVLPGCEEMVVDVYRGSSGAAAENAQQKKAAAQKRREAKANAVLEQNGDEDTTSEAYLAQAKERRKAMDLVPGAPNELKKLRKAPPREEYRVPSIDEPRFPYGWVTDFKSPYQPRDKTPKMDTYMHQQQLNEDFVLPHWETKPVWPKGVMRRRGGVKPTPLRHKYIGGFTRRGLLKPLAIPQETPEEKAAREKREDPNIRGPQYGLRHMRNPKMEYTTLESGAPIGRDLPFNRALFHERERYNRRPQKRHPKGGLLQQPRPGWVDHWTAFDEQRDVVYDHEKKMETRREEMRFPVDERDGRSMRDKDQSNELPSVDLYDELVKDSVTGLNYPKSMAGRIRPVYRSDIGEFKPTKTCTKCEGAGKTVCTACDGTAFVPVKQKFYGTREAKLYKEPCPFCMNTGKKLCYTCKGKGTVEDVKVE